VLRVCKVWKGHVRHLSVPVNIRLIYLVFRVYATILHIEYENLFFSRRLQWHRYCWEWCWTRQTRVSLFSFNSSFRASTQSAFIYSRPITVTLESMHSLHSYAAKNNLTITYFHPYNTYLYTNTSHMLNMDSILSGVKIQNLSPLITLFPKLLSLLLSVPQSYASHSSTYIYTVGSYKPIWKIFSVLSVKVAHQANSELISNTVTLALRGKSRERFSQLKQALSNSQRPRDGHGPVSSDHQQTLQSQTQPRAYRPSCMHYQNISTCDTHTQNLFQCPPLQLMAFILNFKL